ncbi:hypothetical protein ABI59_21525 [Acidobacteria bacterium Mor1]|nr:hypothetical protein ABI59_21525 [Acidobacteria bacterium Mor1]
MDWEKPLFNLRFSLIKPLLVITVLIVGSLAILLAIVGSLGTHRYETAQQGWEETLGGLDDLEREYPSREANATARTLEKLSGELGGDYDLTPRYRRQEREQAPRSGPPPPRVGGYRAWHEASDYWDRATEGRRSDPPQTLLTWADENSQTLDALVRALRSGEPARWELDLAEVYSGPIPNLLAHMNLQRLFAGLALIEQDRGRSERAAGYLDAAWQLNRALRDEPILICQLMSYTIDSRLAVSLRQIDVDPGRWISRLEGLDHRAGLETAIRYEGCSLLAIGDEERIAYTHLGRTFDRLLGRVGRPYVRLCTADSSDRLRRSLEQLSKLDYLCDRDLDLFEIDLSPEGAWWNAFGDNMMPSFDGTVLRLVHLELQEELTREVLLVRQARLNGDTGAGLLGSRSAPSRVCPNDEWVLRTAEDRAGLEIAFRRELSWENEKPEDRRFAFALRHPLTPGPQTPATTR